MRSTRHEGVAHVARVFARARVGDGCPPRESENKCIAMTRKELRRENDELRAALGIREHRTIEEWECLPRAMRDPLAARALIASWGDRVEALVRLGSLLVTTTAVSGWRLPGPYPARLWHAGRGGDPPARTRGGQRRACGATRTASADRALWRRLREHSRLRGACSRLRVDAFVIAAVVTGGAA